MPEVVIRIRQFRDLRTLHLRQAYERALSLAAIQRHDDAVERQWRERVAANIARRKSDGRSRVDASMLLRRQAG